MSNTSINTARILTIPVDTKEDPIVYFVCSVEKLYCSIELFTLLSFQVRRITLNVISQSIFTGLLILFIDFFLIFYHRNKTGDLTNMAIGSSVYQPTTVSYEPRPGSLLSQTTAVSPLQILRKPISQIILLSLGILTIILGKYLVHSSIFIQNFFVLL